MRQKRRSSKIQTLHNNNLWCQFDFIIAIKVYGSNLTRGHKSNWYLDQYNSLSFINSLRYLWAFRRITNLLSLPRRTISVNLDLYSAKVFITQGKNYWTYVSSTSKRELVHIWSPNASDITFYKHKILQRWLKEPKSRFFFNQFDGFSYGFYLNSKIMIKLFFYRKVFEIFSLKIIFRSGNALFTKNKF